MASYKAGFDPPTRPENSRARRLGTYMQQGPPPPRPERPERREVDITNLSGQPEVQKGQVGASRPHRMVVPRPTIRDPSPSTSGNVDARPRGIAPSTFGFGRSAPKPIGGEVPTPQLKSKSSRNVLRRKQSSIAQNAAVTRPPVTRTDSSSPRKMYQSSSSTERRPSIDQSLKSAEAYNDIFAGAGNRSRPQPSASNNTVKESPPIIPELDRYRNHRPEQSTSSSLAKAGVPHKLATHDLPPPTPLLSGTLSGTPHYSGGSNHHRYSGYSGSGYSASPSTRFSESPGPGAYSRDTTPTSMSSQSPGIMVPVKGPATPRLRQASPAHTRPPVTRRRAGSGSASHSETEGKGSDGLPILRESGLSSSSNSTVKDDGKTKEKKKKKRLSPLPPSPPPRKSSQKFKKPLREEAESPSKPSQAPAKPVMTSPLVSSPVKTRSGSSSSTTRPKIPVRPSREGAPDLQAQLGDTLQIIQSNLAGLSYSTQERRKSSLPHPRGVPASPLQHSLPPRSLQNSRLPSRNPSPSPIQPSPREATPAPTGLGIIPDLRPQQIPPSARGTVSRTPSPSVANTKPRFGLFGRRTKTAPEIPTLDTQNKTRRGPAAGTGHEGYGRYGLRGRSTSATGMPSTRDRSASSSRDKLASPITNDPFLLERMSPVIIAGGGEIVENRNLSMELTRTESNQSAILNRPGVDSRASNRSNLSHEAPRTTLWPSALPKDAGKRVSTIIPKGRRPSDSSDDGIGRSTLAFRRSIGRLNNSAIALNLPKPLKMSSVSGASSSAVSLDTNLTSIGSQLQPELKAEADRGRKGQLTKTKKLEKRPRSPRKWNFFHRTQPSAKVETTTTRSAMQVTVGKPAAKSVPHYAMLDSSDEQQEVDPAELEDILREADAAVVELTNEELDAIQFGTYNHDRKKEGEVEKVSTPIIEPPAPLFTSPEPMRPVTPEKKELHMEKQQAPVRPSRLPQVGRIPKVISARPETTSPKSFSRPFARLSTLQPLQAPLVMDKASVALGPSPPKSSTPEPVQPQQSKEETKVEPRHDSGDSKTTDSTAPNHRDFLSFSPRKNSEATTNTSSSGTMSFAATTAVIPEPDAALVEDEVWDEYDDLIGGTNGPGLARQASSAASSSQGAPFHYENYESRRLHLSKIQPKESPTLTAFPKMQEAPRQSFQTTSSVYSIDVNLKVKEALTGIPSPTTPMSFTDFFSGYGDRNNATQESATKHTREGSDESMHSRSSSLLASIAEQENKSPPSQVSLRVGSMTVSKWLTFGHVLFSPAREEIEKSGESGKRHSILVVDGLGNDDWSFYAAETYPNSTFYNLSTSFPPSPTSPSAQKKSPIITPPNHIQIHHSPLSTPTPFPFPANTFTLILFRFPPSLPLAAYQHIIKESHRCLVVGGYLEVSVLDIDMMNMGNRTRRGVRGLKVRIKGGDEDVFLGSVGDAVVREMGAREGEWEGVKSCGVGVPVASLIPSPPSTHSSNSSSTKPTDLTTSTPQAPDPLQPTEKPGQETTLADMILSTSPATDSNITKMVAKVGRWWYSQCYERGFGDSIFEDSRMLVECEKWGTGFKLVVGFGRKGRGNGRGRGASV